MKNDNPVTITLRSHVPPSKPIAGFQFGKPCTLRLSANASVEELKEKYFAGIDHAIGIVTVNGLLVKGNTKLVTGDVVDFFSLIAGG